MQREWGGGRSGKEGTEAPGLPGGISLEIQFVTELAANLKLPGQSSGFGEMGQGSQGEKGIKVLSGCSDSGPQAQSTEEMRGSHY